MSGMFLIADDSPAKTAMLKGLIHASSWDGTILTATTTEESVALIADHDSIACAFVDFYIPSENGPAIIAALKKQHPDCRIALVSSADNAKNFASATQAGAERCICSTNRDAEEEIGTLLEEWAGE